MNYKISLLLAFAVIFNFEEAAAGNCNPNFIDSAGDSCQNLTIYGFCTATGGYGAEWNHDWGSFEDFAVNEETALVCPQCGCKVATEADSGTLRYVDDGCHKERNTPDDVVGFYQPESSEAFVRCCSEDGASCNTPSNCKDPTNLVNYSRAESICSSNGKRLCTKDELLTDICCGTGGKCDSYGVWTSTRNTGDGDDETATTEAQAETTTESGDIPTEVVASCNDTYSYDIVGNMSINSPRYPSAYPSWGVHCSWKLTTIEGYTLKLHPMDFKIEDGYDFLYFYDGPNSSSPLLKTKTGLSWGGDGDHADVYSSSNSVYLEFKTDDVGTRSPGFRFNYLVVPDGYTLMENVYCTGGQYDGTGFDGTLFNTVRFDSLNEAVSVCNKIEECGCVWHDGCGDIFNVAEGSGTSSSTSYSTCDPPTNSYIKP